MSKAKVKKANPEFARRLKDLRESKGLTRPALLDLITKKTGLRMSYNSLANYERGDTNIKEDVSKILAVALDCDPEHFTDKNYTYPTRNDEIAAIMKKSNDENYYMNLAVISLLKLNGYEVKIYDGLHDNAPIDEASITTFIERFMVVSKDGKEVFSLNITELNKLGNNLDKTFNVLLSYYLKDEV